MYSFFRGADDTVLGDGNDNWFEGYAGDDTLSGRAGNDDLVGGLGNDSLDGGEGNDNLYGQQDDDVLTGGIGADFMWGGSGADEFHFEAGDGNDTIGDFEVGTDLLAIGVLTITSTVELDANSDGALDTRVLFSSGDSVDLLFVTGIGDAGELF